VGVTEQIREEGCVIHCSEVNWIEQRGDRKAVWRNPNIVREAKKIRKRGKELSRGIAKIKKILENKNV